MNYTKRTKNPDAIDQWLESHGYYRKHTARDSTCLFRVFSEQLFLTQKYHKLVRAECVKYMKDNASLFENDIDGSLEVYLEAMSEINEFGGLLEIAAMSRLYQCEVFIFEKTTEPLNVTNNGFSKRVLMFHADKHYDSVFHKTYIQNAAFCQSLVYQTLYKFVFKLPDVDFAVNKMLHESSGVGDMKSEILQQVNEDNQTRCTAINNEISQCEMEADPFSTLCVLEDISKCMFHYHALNNTAFSKKAYMNCDNQEPNSAEIFQQIDTKCSKTCFTSNNYGSEIISNENSSLEIQEANYNTNETCYASMIPEFVARVLNLTDFHATDSSISCVKQMLKENLTPFPYKVAKALDLDIYRNIEFDTWNEVRREMRYGNWYNGGTNLQVGVKCLVKLSESQLTWYHCHIQEMSSSGEPCVVFIEELGEKRSVPRDFLQPLPLEQVKPWALPYRHYRNLASTIQNSKLFSFAEYNKMKKSRMGKSRRVKDSHLSNSKNNITQYLLHKNDKNQADNSLNVQDINKIDTDFDKLNKLQDYPSFQFRENDLVSMPVSVIIDDTGSALNSNPQLNINKVSSESFTSVMFNNEVQASYVNQSFAYSYPNSYVWPVNQSAPTYMPDISKSQVCAFESETPSFQMQETAKPMQYMNSTDNVSSDSLKPQYNFQENCRIDDYTTDAVNYLAPKSTLFSGADLPFNDTATLRFFYNLGVDYFNSTCIIRHPFKELENRADITNPNEENENSCKSTIVYEYSNPDELCMKVNNKLSSELNLKHSNNLLIEKPYGMYSTMVPFYPVEEGRNLYVAHYMGMPFGVVSPSFEGQIETVVDQNLNDANFSRPIIYQSNQVPLFTEPSSPGYYRNQVWYPAPQSSYSAQVLPSSP